MSLDSVQARFSVPGVARPWLKGAYPDSTYSEVWRLGVGWTYAGNELAASTLQTRFDGEWVVYESLGSFTAYESHPDYVVYPTHPSWEVY